MNIKNVNSIVLSASVSLFIISLMQEAYCTNQCKASLGVLLAGGLGVLLEIGALMDKFLNINTVVKN